jgi:YbgC/YbaW family acyl-CoA thioester hydrolase
MKIDNFRLVHRLRVRWAEVDMQKIVFNAHYLMYFDTAITDYWRALALPYEEAMVLLGGELYVKKASVEYHGSAHFDDRLVVGLKCERIGNSSMLFTGAIFRDDELLITCELVYVFADPVSQTSRPVPPGLRSLIERFEAGESILEIKLGNWAELGLVAASIQASVIVETSAPENEWKEADSSAIYAVGFNALGQRIATGRLLGQCNGSSKIEHLVVHRALRGAGMGRAVLGALVGVAQQRGDQEVMLQTRCGEQAFYQREGFMTRAEPFFKAGSMRREMFKSL